MSSLAIFAPGRAGSGPPANENDFPSDPAEHDLGYTASKWAAERLVRQAGERGLAVTVFRPGLILAHSRTGVANRSDLLTRLIRSWILLGVAPDVETAVDLTPVDFVSRAMVRLSLSPGSAGRTYHLRNRSTVPLGRLVEWLCDEGYRIRRVSYDDWLAAMARHDSDEASRLLQEFLAGPAGRRYLQAPPGSTLLDRLADGSSAQALEQGGIVCPEPGPELLKVCLAHLRSTGWLPPPAATPG
ncbi:MAG: SDR family oxidoreductase [Candidatus Riflebacteria bacterium]|nr:SDR family oxidoreductase [Candidatus Riflebacteria bacterium]